MTPDLAIVAVFGAPTTCGIGIAGSRPSDWRTTIRERVGSAARRCTYVLPVAPARPDDERSTKWSALTSHLPSPASSAASSFSIWSPSYGFHLASPAQNHLATIAFCFPLASSPPDRRPPPAATPAASPPPRAPRAAPRAARRARASCPRLSAPRFASSSRSSPTFIFDGLRSSSSSSTIGAAAVARRRAARGGRACRSPLHQHFLDAGRVLAEGGEAVAEDAHLQLRDVLHLERGGRDFGSLESGEGRRISGAA